jgi:hypothetical protein
MPVIDRRPLWVWTAIVAAALVLLVAVVLSTRSRHAETETVVQQVPEATPAPAPPPPAATPAPPAPPSQPAVPSTPGAAARPDPESQVAGRRESAPPDPPQFPGSAAGRPGGKVIVTPVPPPDQPDTPSPTPDSGTFRDTGLPDRITYRGLDWMARDLIEGLPATLLEAGEPKANGFTVYHDRNAEPPYAHVYVPVAGETDHYVRYMPLRL